MTLALAQSHHMPPPQPARVPTPILLYVLCVKPCLSIPKVVKGACQEGGAVDAGQRIRCLLIIRTESPMGLLSRWVAYAGGRLQSQDVYMGLEAINLDIVDGLFGI